MKPVVIDMGQQLNGYSARYSVRFSQLSQPITPDVTFVFVSRLQKRWDSFLIIPRDVLYRSHIANDAGSRTQAGNVSFYFNYDETSVTCSKQNFSGYLNNWDAWPIVNH